jgi:NADH-quinone oxidoreductase subunit M
MFGTYISVSEVILWTPLLGALLLFGFVKNEGQAKNIALIFSLLALLACGGAVWYYQQYQHFYQQMVSNPASPNYQTFYERYLEYYNILNANWVWWQELGSSFALFIDGMGLLLLLLTCIAFPVIFISQRNTSFNRPVSFYALMLLSQTGLIGVFLAKDALLFYVFWELALIPVYFLVSMWGGERRIKAAFKFFIYTFVGSLLMLVALIYLYNHPTNYSHSFSLDAFRKLTLSSTEGMMIFWALFIAFAIKMPIFPFHTWQPDTYDQSATPVTMVLSGIMVKMGLFAVVRWLIPTAYLAVDHYSKIVIILCIISILYASMLALVQDNIKKLVAYSSIAHIGLMCAALFVNNRTGMYGSIVQMFSHGINIIGLWIVIDIIERQTGTKKMSELGGLARKAPVLAIMLVIIALANIALPLTNAFVGEFMMFNGLFRQNLWLAAAAGIGIILSAVYTLNMISKVFYGNNNEVTERFTDISFNQKLALSVLIVAIFVFGVFPKPMIDAAKETVEYFSQRIA